MTKFLIFFALLILLIFGGLYFVYVSTLPEEGGVNTPIVVDQTPVLIDRVNYICNEKKTIDAAFYESPATPAAAVGQPPTPNGEVKILLSDGRSFDLPQTISADGARYANADETFVFWGKGNGALVLEDNVEKSYIGCVLVAPVVIGVDLPAMYGSPDGMFSLRLPSLVNANTDGYSVDESFKNELSPDLRISGVKFTIPKDLAKGTNLSSDTYLSVESIPATQICTADLFFDGDKKATQKTDAGVIYSVATSSDAGAGNRYEEIVYALPGTNPCMAVRYFIHYTVLENYATGTVTAFNREALVTSFDHIRQSLVVNQ